MMGSTHTYDLPGATPAGKRLDPGAVEMALNPEEVDMMDSDALQVSFLILLIYSANIFATSEFSRIFL